jgi:hypothetical protein
MLDLQQLKAAATKLLGKEIEVVTFDNGRVITQGGVHNGAEGWADDVFGDYVAKEDVFRLLELVFGDVSISNTADGRLLKFQPHPVCKRCALTYCNSPDCPQIRNYEHLPPLPSTTIESPKAWEAFDEATLQSLKDKKG